MKIASLFTGIGGLERGLSQAGHETLITCEIWEPAVVVLRGSIGGAKHHDDVRTLASLPPGTELLTAGFPCQDLSQAGRTAGIKGSKSGLVENVFRLLKDHPVPYVLLENVSFMLQLDGGAAMLKITRWLEELGFSWAYRTINSLSFVPQRRERVFLLASRGELNPADVLLVEEAEPRVVRTTLKSHAHGFYWTEGTRGLGWAPDAIPTLKNGSTVGIPSPPAILLPTGSLIKPDIRDAERLQGFPADYTLAAAEIRPSLRWSLLGNAVTVNVAEWVGQKLRNPGSYDGSRDTAWRPAGRGWPRAARSSLEGPVQVDVGPYPVWCDRKPLHEFLQHAGEPLSVRATAGFLKRAEASSLRFEPGFLDALRLHLDRHTDRPLAA